MEVNNKKQTPAVTGLVLGGPLDGTFLTHNGEIYQYKREGVNPYSYSWDCIYCGPNANEVVSFWRPTKRSTYWMVARLATFYREQMEGINRKREGAVRT